MYSYLYGIPFGINPFFSYLCQYIRFEIKMAVIKLDDIVKARLDTLKGKSTYNDYLEKMIAYFEVTKIVPETSLIPPTEEVKKAASRIIEVMRGIEKKQSAQLEAIRNILLDSDSVPVNEIDYVRVEEVQELIGRYKDLEAEANKLKEENNRLKITPSEVARYSGKGEKPDPLVSKIIGDLETKFEADRFDPQYQRIDKSVLEQALKRIKDLL